MFKVKLDRLTTNSSAIATTTAFIQVSKRFARHQNQKLWHLKNKVNREVVSQCQIKKTAKVM